MSNTNNNMQNQTSTALHNAIMKVGGKDRPPMLAPESTYKFKWTEKIVPVAEIVLTGINNDIYSIVDACPNACEMWKAIERLKLEWQRFLILVKKSQELKIVSYHKLYDILKKHQNKVDEIRAKRLAHHNKLLPRNRGKAIINSPPPTYDQEPTMVAEDDKMSKEKEIDKLMDLISLDDTDDEPNDQELKAHYMYMAQIQEVTSDTTDNSRPIFDAESLQKEQGDNNITIDSMDMSTNKETVDHDNDDLAREHLKKFQAKLDRYHDVNYALKVEIDCAKAKGVISTTSISRPQLKSNQLEDRVMHNNSERKKQQVEDHRRSFKFSNNYIILFITDSGCSKHMTRNLKLLSNFMEQFLDTVKFGNDQIEPILGYGDLVQENVTIKRVYYVEGLNHNLLSVGQFCDADLEVAFRKSTCYVRDLKGNDLLTGSHGSNLYSITLQGTSTPNLICLMAKASSSQA
uniref:Integrase, catalytic region, zinc finger, CCHC-type, peptidase aspartic, catalytic n=1 Tax=Tanacetum cinerariifolium TaxID=118510 RepID=A0A6L2JXK6_TANCI|nr:integrase, catalytic region, zinc finger, CCHC-type, peptidase aspartic, catalytic [Tanacetum cinerariifolium]